LHPLQTTDRQTNRQTTTTPKTPYSVAEVRQKDSDVNIFL